MRFRMWSKVATHKVGTKFYRVIYIEFGPASIAICNWGPKKGALPFPKDSPSSRCSYHHGERESFADQIIREKSKRGYEHWTNDDGFQFNGESFDAPIMPELRKLLSPMLSGNELTAIVDYLTGETIEDVPNVVSATKSQPAASSTDPDWGSW